MNHTITKSEQETIDAGVKEGRMQMRPVPSENPEKLSTDELAVLLELRNRGFAVCVFNPSEIRGADIDTLEDRMTATGWDVIGGPWEEDEEPT